MSAARPPEGAHTVAEGGGTPVGLATVDPGDKYTLRQGRTGTQALARLPMTQQQRARRAGRNTASACARPNGKSSRGAARSRQPSPSPTSSCWRSRTGTRRPGCMSAADSCTAWRSNSKATTGWSSTRPRRDPATGAPRKRAFGAWTIVPLRFLRGTALDLFGIRQSAAPSGR
ncbi:hypothetical protein D5047_21390 [Verminephrobacter eiseniae]|nr:hypothetical protein [Verminephrobacter eiseniae]MCW5238654.1 hypothetical protein [Verminephrobacter eiseniae]